MKSGHTKTGKQKSWSVWIDCCPALLDETFHKISELFECCRSPNTVTETALKYSTGVFHRRNCPVKISIHLRNHRRYHRNHGFHAPFNRDVEVSE